MLITPRTGKQANSYRNPEISHKLKCVCTHEHLRDKIQRTIETF